MNRIVEYVFFFGFMGVVGFLIWKMLAPFIAALALAAIIVTICYPVHEMILARTPKQNRSLAALFSTILVIVVIVIPLTFIISVIAGEVSATYETLNDESQQAGIEQTITQLERQVQVFVPDFNIDVTTYAKQATDWFSENATAILTGAASTVFLFFIALIGSFYLFRDGRDFTKQLVIISPLPDDEDELILKRMANAVRSVATGTLLIALIQGTLTALGLYIVGFERAILWGTFASIGALIPGVGTSIVLIPSVLFLLFSGEFILAIGLTVWGMLAVGLIDNLLGPYLMSRGNNMHPFVILLAVLGGLVVFGPIGFIVGPVIVSLFIVLLELYSAHIASQPDE